VLELLLLDRLLLLIRAVVVVPAVVVVVPAIVVPAVPALVVAPLVAVAVVVAALLLRELPDRDPVLLTLPLELRLWKSIEAFESAPSTPLDDPSVSGELPLHAAVDMHAATDIDAAIALQRARETTFTRILFMRNLSIAVLLKNHRRER
jgi:hypothetical protein